MYRYERKRPIHEVCCLFSKKIKYNYIQRPDFEFKFPVWLPKLFIWQDFVCMPMLQYKPVFVWSRPGKHVPRPCMERFTVNQ